MLAANKIDPGFPELSLTGYVLQDLVPSVSCRPSLDDPIFKQLLKASRRLDMVVGFVDEDARHRFFIASAYLSRGEVVHIHHKVYLPTYGLFDEGRFFAPGDCVRAFNTCFGRGNADRKIGMSPTYLLWQDGADLLCRLLRQVVDSADADGSSSWWSNQCAAGLFAFVACQPLWFEDAINFWGG
jgi:hypothetical protein